MSMAKDKIKHSLAGVALSFVTGLLCSLIRRYLPIWAKISPALVGFVVSATIGALKELVWDKWCKKGTPEWLDFWATCWGGVIGLVLLKILGVG